MLKVRLKGEKDGEDKMLVVVGKAGGGGGRGGENLDREERQL